MKWFGWQSCRYIFPATVLLLVVGCGGTGNVGGKVTFKGQPLPGGMVTLQSTEGGEIRTYPGLIKDGSYTVPNVPIGPAKVTIGTAKARGNILHPEDVKDPWGPYVHIPRHYADPEKSGYKVDVSRGKTELNIDLKDDFEPDELVLENK
jgi:hypothetical protein